MQGSLFGGFSNIRGLFGAPFLDFLFLCIASRKEALVTSAKSEVSTILFNSPGVEDRNQPCRIGAELL